MKKTIEIDSWDIGDLLNEASDDVDADCTVQQLIQMLQRIDGIRPADLDNLRLVGHYDYDDVRMKLVGDREETAEEAAEREQQEQVQVRRYLLNELVDHHWVHDAGFVTAHGASKFKRSEFIQARGWDKLQLEELQTLVAKADKEGAW